MSRGSFVIRRCALRGVEAVVAHSSHVFPRHTHDGYGIGLMTSGAQRSWSGRGTVEAEQGNLITCNPEEVHDGVPIAGARGWKMLYLTADRVRNVVADLREDGASDFEFSSPVIDHRGQAHIFEAAYDALTEKHADAGRAEERLMQLLDCLSDNKRAVVNDAPAGMARARELIDEDPSASITLADLSAAAGSTRFQVVRGFFKLTGLTPHAYLVQRRLDLARVLLRKGQTLTEVAVSCGFADQSHFTRTFVRRYGVTPGEYLQAVS
jgi:AraC-like DNA-binding protein